MSALPYRYRSGFTAHDISRPFASRSSHKLKGKNVEVVVLPRGDKKSPKWPARIFIARPKSSLSRVSPKLRINCEKFPVGNFQEKKK